MFRFASLTRRPRGRALFEHLLRSSELVPFRDLAVRRPTDFRGPRPGLVAHRLGELLGDWEPDLSRLDEDAAALYRETTDPDDLLYLRLHLAVWQEAPGFLEASGLSRAEPPESVHSMARGPLAAGGSLGAADMILNAITGPGGELPPIRRALDFGASSGRVVRVLAAQLTDVEWQGCDPNEGATAWAAEHVPGASFFVSPQDPPLDVPDAHYDLVFAVSVWSHFGEDAAREWFAEMHRVVKPGGLLVFTSQGYSAAAVVAKARQWDPLHVNQCIADLYATGFHFRDPFGEDGDHGITHDQWGWAMTSPEWVLRAVSDAWAVRHFGPGEHEHLQDVWALERRPAGPPKRGGRFQRGRRSQVA